MPADIDTFVERRCGMVSQTRTRSMSDMLNAFKQIDIHMVDDVRSNEWDEVQKELDAAGLEMQPGCMLAVVLRAG